MTSTFTSPNFKYYFRPSLAPSPCAFPAIISIPIKLKVSLYITFSYARQRDALWSAAASRRFYNRNQTTRSIYYSIQAHEPAPSSQKREQAPALQNSVGAPTISTAPKTPSSSFPNIVILPALSECEGSLFDPCVLLPNFPRPSAGCPTLGF